MDTFDNIAQYPIYFAPGCRLMQLEPAMVSEVYDYLKKLFGNIHLYTRCCAFDDAKQHDEEAVFITLCDSCFKIYGETYANLHMRDFWSIYDEYKSVYPLGENEAKLRNALDSTMCAPAPINAMRPFFDEWKTWSTSHREPEK